MDDALSQHDSDREEWDKLLWLKYEQRIEVDAEIDVLIDRRAREATTFDELVAPLEEPQGVRVARRGLPTLAERLAAAPVSRVHVPSGTFYGHRGDVRYPLR